MTLSILYRFCYVDIPIVVCGEVNLVNPSPSIGMKYIPISQHYERDEEEKISSKPLACR